MREFEKRLRGGRGLSPPCSVGSGRKWPEKSSFEGLLRGGVSGGPPAPFP